MVIKVGYPTSCECDTVLHLHGRSISMSGWLNLVGVMCDKIGYIYDLWLSTGPIIDQPNIRLFLIKFPFPPTVL